MALSLLYSTSNLLQQLDLLDREPVPRNMEGLMVDELMDVPDTPDRLAGLRKTGHGSAGSVLEKVDDVRHACQKDNKIPMEKFEEEVRASINPNAEKANSFSLSKEILRRRRSNWSSNTNEGRWPSVSLGEGHCPSHYQHQHAVNNMEDNIEAETLVRHACASEDFDNTNHTFPISESACSDNLFSRNGGRARIVMDNGTEFCSRFQSKGSRTFNRRGRLSLQSKKISEVDIGPPLLPVLSHGQTNQQPAVAGTSSNPDASCFHKAQSGGSGSSLWGGCPVSGPNQSGTSFDSSVQHEADNTFSSGSKVEALSLSKGDVVELSSAGLRRNNPSAFKYPAISRGRSALGKCNSNNSRESSSGMISAKFNPKENEISNGTSTPSYSKIHMVHDSGPVDNLTRRGKIDLESAYPVRSTLHAEAKKYQLSGRMGSWVHKLDNSASKGTKNEKKQDGLARHIDHRTTDMDRKSTKDVKKMKMHSESLPRHKVIEVSSLNSTIVPRQTRGRRLVRNGCISPVNIARMHRVSSEGNKKVIDNVQSLSEDMDANENNVTKHSSEVEKVEKKKGKEVMIDSIVADVPSVSERHLLDRKELAFPQEPTDSLRICGTHDGMMEDSWDWRGANCSSKEVFLSPSEKKDEVFLGSSNDAHEMLHGRENLNTVVHLDLDNDSNDTCTLGLSESRIDLPPVQATSTTLFDTQPNNERKNRGGRIVMKRQRRSSSIADNYQLGEGSSTSYVGPAFARMQSSRQPSHVSSTRRSRNHQAGSIFENVIEIDDSSSPKINSHSGEVNANCAAEDDAGAKARQVEADELLARQLQEQFYREVMGAGNDEIDANIAQTLQEEEISRNAPSTSIINQDLPFHPRVSTAADFNRPFLLRSSENSTVWATTRSVTSSSRLAQLRRSIHYRSSVPHSGRRLRFPSNMSLEMRIQLLEALDGIVGSDGSFAADRFLTTERDFNENDYEMLLALDNDNDRHTGASAEQINRLPLSQVQVDNSGEVCAVCLETPAVGDQIRHLPCLHKFHKECIDPWFRRRSSCPICKSSINGC